MLTLHPQFLKDGNGQNSLVVLPAKEFDNIMEKLEDFIDIEKYTASKKKGQSFVDAETAFKKIEAKRKKNV
jgi:hypothetical protein